MSLLNNQESTQFKKVLSQLALIVNQPSNILNILYTQWELSFDLIFKDGIPSAKSKLAALGTNAKELFDLNTALTQFMISQLSGKRDDLVAKIIAKLATIPAYTIHDDGTVTINDIPVEIPVEAPVEAPVETISMPSE